MPLQYSDHVIGGIDRPRFLLLGPELSPNLGFEENTTGIAGTGVNTREFDETTPFGDYVLTIQDDNAGAQEYALITIPTGAAVAQKRFVALFYARNDADEGDQAAWSDWINMSGTHFQEYALGQDWQSIVHEVVVHALAAGNDLSLVIYPFGKGQGNSGVGKIRIDNFLCRQVLEELSLPDVLRGNERQMWAKEWQARNELIDGSSKSYKKGERYAYESFYERLTAAEEAIVRKIRNTSYDILFFPHADSPTCYLVEWDEDYESTWAFGVAAWGHESTINLKGIELTPAMPTEVIDATNEYAPEADALILDQNEDNFIFS